MSTSEYPARRIDGPWLMRLRAAGAVRSLPTDIWIVAALVLLGALIRIITIDSQSIWSDEALTAYEAQLPLGAMIHTVATVETTPPLFFVLTWLSVHVFGPGDTAVRLVSTLAGIAIVPIAYLAGRELLSRRAGLLAAALAVISPCLVWYSQEARAYMLVCTLSAASFLWFVRARDDPSVRNLVWWAACSSLALMTHFFAGYVVAPEAVWLLWVARSRRVFVAVGTVAAAQLAMLPLAFVDTTHGAGWIAASSPRIWRIGEVPLELGLATLYRVYSRTQGLIGGGSLLVVAVALQLFAGDLRSRRAAKLAATVAGAGILTPLLVGLVGPDYFLSRNLMPVWLPLELALVAACFAPRARLVGGALAAVLLGGFALATVRTQTEASLQRPDWRALAQEIGPTTSTRAIIAASGAASDPLKIYLPHVNWVEQHTAPELVSEIDVVGAKRRQSVLPLGATSYTLPDGLGTPAVRGQAVPAFVGPRGTRLLERQRIDEWTLARFRLNHPEWLDINQLIALTPRFFRRAPIDLLVFFQEPGDRQGARGHD
jgi:4-amino-4-deoxy-L-arabinose transferase-like glycosyltransferase